MKVVKSSGLLAAVPQGSNRLLSPEKMVGVLRTSAGVKMNAEHPNIDKHRADLGRDARTHLRASQLKPGVTRVFNPDLQRGVLMEIPQ